MPCAVEAEAGAKAAADEDDDDDDEEEANTLWGNLLRKRGSKTCMERKLEEL